MLNFNLPSEVLPATLTVGDRVVVGPRFVMGDRVGQGSMVADVWTGRTMVVVSVYAGSRNTQPSADLADPADPEYALTNIVTRRLTPAA